ncbi:hypothetical protein ES708_15160 [subsurface metagenome]
MGFVWFLPFVRAGLTSLGGYWVILKKSEGVFWNSVGFIIKG